MLSADIVADVAVVGGGPAGAAAATTLARAGQDVVLVDKARFPRDKCCGDGLTAAALRELEALGLRRDAVPGWQVVTDVHLRSPSGRQVHLPLPRDGLYAVVAPRASLDAAVLELARVAGAKVLDGHALTGAAADADGVRLEVAGLGEVHAPYAIGADGAWSPLRKAMGAHQAGYLGDWHAFRQYFGDCAPAARDMWVWFDPDLLPGYMWSFPLPGGRANVGFGLERNEDFDAHRMGELWPELLERPHVRAVLGESARAEAPHKAWPIPARVRDVPLTAGGGRVLFTGDAACATDPLTGEGIAQA
ncbi:MAG: NAD(P)/FAD-dependent oxidoreductase, partial [Acidimicrobiales bacterium]